MNDDSPASSVRFLRIRPEGIAMPYRQFTSSQREAFRRLLYTLEEATSSLQRLPENVGKGIEHRFRPNNVVFISGSRGTGKTCLLNGIIRYTSRGADEQTETELKDFYSRSSRRWPAVDAARKNVEWLPTIDIDPIPPDFDLVTSVLVRIRTLIQQQPDHSRFGMQPRDLGSTAGQFDLDLEYSRLLVDASSGWQGGLLGAKQTTEPEIFADASEKLAQSNIDFSERFNRFLDMVARRYFSQSTIFALPIDDTDLKPPRGLGVLKLLRMLHSRRLFVVAMGDIDLLELVSSLDMMRELGFKDQVDRSALLPVNPDTVRRHVSAITATALRKLIPLDQRIELTSCEVGDGLSFRPHGAPQSLRSLLKSIPIVIDHHMQIRTSATVDHNDGEESSVTLPRQMKMELSLFEFLFTRCDALRRKPQHQPEQQATAAAAGGRAESQQKLYLENFQAMVLELTGKNANRDAGCDDAALVSANSEDAAQLDPHIYYFGRRCLQSSARRVTDFWFVLHRLQRFTERLGETFRTGTLSGQKKESNSRGESRSASSLEDAYRDFWDQVLGTFQKLSRQTLMEESVLDVNQRELIDHAFDEHSGSVDWSDMPLTLRPMFGKGRSVTRLSRYDRLRRLLDQIPADGDSDNRRLSDDEVLDVTTGATVRYYFNPPKMWTVETGSAATVRAEVRKALQERKDYFNRFDHRPISTDAAAMLSLYHDLLQFSYRGESFYPHFVDMSVYEGMPWAYTAFETGPQNRCIFYWPAPPSVSVYGLDYFARLWGAACKEGANIGVHRSAVIWILFGNAVVSSWAVEHDDFQEYVRDMSPFTRKNETSDRNPSVEIHEILESMLQLLLEKAEDESVSELLDSQRAEEERSRADDAPAAQKNRTDGSQRASKSGILRRILKRRFEQIGCRLLLNQPAASGNEASRSSNEKADGNSDPDAKSVPKSGASQGEEPHEVRRDRCIDRGFEELKKPFRQYLKEDSVARRSSKAEASIGCARQFVDEVASMFQTAKVCETARRQLNLVSEAALELGRERPESDVGRNHRDWLLNVITMSMPEFGISGELRRDLLFGMEGISHEHTLDGADRVDAFLQFICINRRAIRGRRARRLAKLVWMGHPHLAVRLAYADPNLYGQQTRLSAHGFFRAFHLIHGDHDALVSGLYRYNDDARVKEAINMLFDDPEDARSFTESEKPGARVHKLYEQQGDPQQALSRVVAKAAESLAEWDSTSEENHTRNFRELCLKRLFRLAGELNFNWEERRQAESDASTKLVENRFHIWQRMGRSLTPSVEEIELAGATLFGADEWKEVSLEKVGYHLDFAEQSYYRR